MLAIALGVGGTALVVGSRAVGSYAGLWTLGAIAFLFLMVRGRAFERVVLLILLGLSLLRDGEAFYWAIRQTMFAAAFLLLSGYAIIGIGTLLLIYLAGFVAYLFIVGEASPFFTVGPAVAFLLVAARSVQSDEWNQASGQPPTRLPSAALFSIFSLAFSLVGSGSRAVMLVWAAFMARKVTISMVLVAALGFAVVMMIPELEVVDRFFNTFNELSDPFPESGINMRAVEALVFISWFETASTMELFVGSNEMIFLPGDFLGFDFDPAFIPHNQIFGTLFQFGFIGIGVLGILFYARWRDFRFFPMGRYLLFVYLLIGMAVLGGFVNGDLAVVAAAARYQMHLLPPQPYRRRGR